ncbi:hypothetical protein ACYE2N_01655 [Flavobacterium sp. MAHUQ-51]|uniref:hypothetical protein n=1 Tax=Flavobacterium sp. GCM10022190 TaxID=3252639 RepID=UPI00360CB760
MQPIQGISRHQLQLSSLEDEITADNSVRFDSYTDLIGLEKVNGEHSLIMLVYNIKRSINILGVPDLIAKLHKWNSPYKRKDLFLLKTTYLKPKSDFIFCQTKLAA